MSQANKGLRPLYKKVDAINNKTTHLHYIFGVGSQPIASHVVEKVGTAPATTDTEYYHRDHLDSLEAVSTDNGTVTYVSHDAWGKRRNENWTDATSGLASVKGNLEYTGHERIPEIGLIHMNGRVYDPTLGRFLSADPHIQFDGDLQSYNRYSYVLNNPMRYNDPSGYYVQIIIAAVMAAYEVYEWIAIVLAIYSMLETYYHTGDARMAIWVGIVTYASAHIASGIGEWAGANPSTGRFFAKAAMHGINGGMTSAALGGDFKDGAVGAFVVTLGESTIFKAVPRDSSNATASRTVLAAVVGGTASKLTGGKFANGALSGAFKWLFNTEGIFSRRRVPGTDPFLVPRIDPETGLQQRVTLAEDDPKRMNIAGGSKWTDTVKNQVASGVAAGVLDLASKSLSVEVGYQIVQDFLIFEQWEYTEMVIYDVDDAGAIVGKPMLDLKNGGATYIEQVFKPVGGTYVMPSGMSCLVGTCGTYEY